MRPKELQRRYYAATAARYDEMHVREEDEHSRALRYLSSFLPLLGISTVLDVGCGTGRALKRLREMGVVARGVEPVSALIAQAIDRNGVPKEMMVCASGDRLPFRDGAFDAVTAFALFHHVKRPDPIVLEMIRVARKAVFISDTNRFGRGGYLNRLTKLLIYKLRLWRPAYFIRTLGRGYQWSEGDGVSYSYSVFDSYDLLAKWAEAVVLIPTKGGPASLSWAHPLLTSSHILLCALKKGP
jgi:SAM-dependent methyltransferase